jgi:hypothetical protein
MSGHTPGPWKVGARSCEWNSPASPYLHVDGDRGPLVAKVRMRQDMDTLGGEECLANARLIAAAPDLLAACKMIASFAVSWEPLTPGDIRVVTDAIAKAEGR